MRSPARGGRAPIAQDRISARGIRTVNKSSKCGIKLILNSPPPPLSTNSEKSFNMTSQKLKSSPSSNVKPCTRRKTNFDSTIIFRWDLDKENYLRDMAKARQLTISQYLRLLLDRFVVSRGYK